MNINVSDLQRSLAIYGPVPSFLGYERAGSWSEGEDWKRWLEGTPHEISIIQADEGYYATFFFDPDGLKFEFVITPQYEGKRRARMERNPSATTP